MRRTASALALCALAWTAGAACVDGATAPDPGGVAAGSGARMCAVLRAADLVVVGLAPALLAPDVDVGDGGRTATCTWTTSPLPAERIALSLAYPAASPPVTWGGVLEGLEPFVTLSRPALPYVDEALVGSTIATSIQPDGRAFPWILVRRGREVVRLDVPAGPHARDQLIALASTVLARLPALAGSRTPAGPPATGWPDACGAAPAAELGATAVAAVALVVLGRTWSDCTLRGGRLSVNVLIEDEGSRAAAVGDARLLGSLPLPGVGDAAWTGPPAAYGSAVFAARGSREVEVTASGDGGLDYAAVADRVATAAVRNV